MDSVSRTALAVVGSSAIEIARSIASGEISASEVVEAHVQRIEAVNPSLNAVVVPLFDSARAEAKAADATRQRGEALGPLHGVPITIKESFDVAGCATNVGVSELAQSKATQNGVLVERLKQAGAIILGKTNVAQLLMLNETDNPVYGRTNNPWQLERAPGGSSGGEAAIIAAGGSCLGLGSDIGGSVRLPAAACGIHSLKPTTGRLTLVGHAPLYPGQEAIVAQPGPMARSVTDLNLAMKILAAPGQQVFDPTIPPVPWQEPSAVTLKNLRIAFYTDNGIITPLPAIRRAVREAAEALQKHGAVLEEWTPPNLLKAWQLCVQLFTADGYACVRRQLGKSQKDWRINQFLQSASLPRSVGRAMAGVLKLIGQHFLAINAPYVGSLSVNNYWQVVDERNRYRDEFIAELNARQFDAIICPPTALVALTHGSSFLLGNDGTYATLYNLLGMPAGVVAATRVRPGEESDRVPSRDIVERTAYQVEQGSAGLPVGVQVVAHHWREDVVLAVMSALEEHFKSQPDYPVHPPVVYQ